MGRTHVRKTEGELIVKSYKKLYSVVGITLIATVMVLTAVIVFQNTDVQQKIDYKEIIVNPGDTLWGIAKATAPDQDPRKIIWDIRQINELEQAIVYPGQILVIPTYVESM